MKNTGFYQKEKENTGRRRGWNAVTVVLFVCALPVLIPLVCGAVAVLLGAVLAVAGGAIAIVTGAVGGLLALLAGAAGCILAATVSLAALLFGSLLGIGFGSVLLFSAPASALAILGVSLMAAGGGILGSLLLWQICVFLIRVFRGLTGWTRERILQRKEKRAMRAAQAAAKEEGGQDA